MLTSSSRFGTVLEMYQCFNMNSEFNLLCPKNILKLDSTKTELCISIFQKTNEVNKTVVFKDCHFVHYLYTLQFGTQKYFKICSRASWTALWAFLYILIMLFTVIKFKIINIFPYSLCLTTILYLWRNIKLYLAPYPFFLRKERTAFHSCKVINNCG